MSRVTLFGFIWLFATQAFAGAALEEAQAKRSKAFNDFYNQYKASRHTPEDAKAISDQTIAPASAATTRALNQEKVQALKNSKIQVLTAAEAALADRRSQSEEDAGESDESEGAANGKTAEDKSSKGDVQMTVSGTSAAPVTRRPATPEPVIDGKTIPKEITFGQ